MKRAKSQKKTGRPKIKGITAAQVQKLAAIGCTDTEIGEFFNCSADTVKNRFSENLIKGRAEVKNKLRRAQLKSALKGNVVMLIWLGKQMLGQSDKVDIPDANVTITIRDESPDEPPVPN